MAASSSALLDLSVFGGGWGGYGGSLRGHASSLGR